MDGFAGQEDRSKNRYLRISLLIFLLKSKRKIFSTAILIGLLAGACSFFIAPYFTSTVVVVPPQLRMASASALINQIGGTGVSLSGLSGLESALQMKSQADALTVLLTTWPVENAVIMKFDLEKIYKVKKISDARKALTRRTTINADKGFLFITVKDTDKDRASAIANNYVEQVRAAMKNMALSEASQRRIFYEQQFDKTKEDLTNAEVSFEQTQQANHVISVDAKAKMAIEGAASIRSQITAHEVELTRLRSYLTDSNAQVQLVESELSALRTRLAGFESNEPGGYTGMSLGNVPREEISYIRASRELKYHEALYELMLKQYEASRIDEARDAPYVQVVEPAIPSERKAGPHHTYFAIGGGLFGFFCAVAWQIYSYWRKNLPFEDAALVSSVRTATFEW